MTQPAFIPLAPLRSNTVIQEGSAYKEEFFLPADGSGSPRLEFRAAEGGALIATISGQVSGRSVTFEVPYSEIDDVPNGASFYCYLNVGSGDDHLVAYGTVFRRQLAFPNSSQYNVNNLSYVDDFQRPAGPVGSRWTTLVGRPEIFDNRGLLGNMPNTVGPKFNFFSRYFMRYYQPFKDDQINVRVGLTDRGNGLTMIALCGCTDMSSYIYARFQSTPSGNQLELGIGTGPDVGGDIAPVNLTPFTSEVNVTIPKDGNLGIFRVKYNEANRTLSVTNDAGSFTHLSWTDSQGIAPHGRGYRYFGLGGRAALVNSGVQIGYWSAQREL